MDCSFATGLLSSVSLFLPFPFPIGPPGYRSPSGQNCPGYRNQSGQNCPGYQNPSGQNCPGGRRPNFGGIPEPKRPDLLGRPDGRSRPEAKFWRDTGAQAARIAREVGWPDAKFWQDTGTQAARIAHEQFTANLQLMPAMSNLLQICSSMPQ
jgi:hypothetical protein